MLGRVAKVVLAFAACLQAACGSGEREPGADGPRLPQGELAGIYAGDFPCSNCAAIEATLWLREDGRFLFRQRYALDDGTADYASHALGHWRWDESAGLLVLAGVGPDRRFAQVGADRLEMQVYSPAEHGLIRDPLAAPPVDSFRIEGESVVGRSGIAFTECITGLALEVAPGAGYEELLRQHRRLNRNGPAALTEIEAHLEQLEGPDDTSREVLVVDRFLSLKPRTPCRGGG